MTRKFLRQNGMRLGFADADLEASGVSLAMITQAKATLEILSGQRAKTLPLRQELVLGEISCRWVMFSRQNESNLRMIICSKHGLMLLQFLGTDDAHVVVNLLTCCV